MRVKAGQGRGEARQRRGEGEVKPSEARVRRMGGEGERGTRRMGALGIQEFLDVTQVLEFVILFELLGILDCPEFLERLGF